MSITLIIVIITVLISLQGFNNPGIIEKLKHWPYAESRDGEWYRLITSGFVHGGWLHLLINMFVLWQFGEIVESWYNELFGEVMGPTLYVLMYLSTIAVADLPTYFKHKNDYNYAAIGASGAVSGIVFIFILVLPWQMLYIWGVLPIPSIVAGVAYLVYSQYASRQSNTRIDHDAHFYGAIYGVLFTIVFAPELIGRFWERLTDLPF
jgi:membrane associated rhomboid family serine protease